MKFSTLLLSAAVLALSASNVALAQVDLPEVTHSGYLPVCAVCVCVCFSGDDVRDMLCTNFDRSGAG